jgi:hypothetical protein
MVVDSDLDADSYYNLSYQVLLVKKEAKPPMAKLEVISSKPVDNI